MTARRALSWFDVMFTALIGCVWIASGIDKTIYFGDFMNVVAAHGVIRLGAGAIAFIPGAEVVVGLGVLALTHGGARLMILVASASLLLLFSVYLYMIPKGTISSVGCGCAMSTLSALDRVAWWPWVRNATLGVCHLWLIVGLARGGGRTSDRLTSSVL